jgi:hypothetical protein
MPPRARRAPAPLLPRPPLAPPPAATFTHTHTRTRSLTLLTLLLLAAAPRAARGLDNGLGATPAMGWSSWNTFRCDISASLILQVADAIVSSGLADAGYRYVNVDDCWMLHGRDASGHLVVDVKKFPEGMKALGDALHERGLLFGIYSAVRARRGAACGAACVPRPRRVPCVRARAVGCGAPACVRVAACEGFAYVSSVCVWLTRAAAALCQAGNKTCEGYAASWGHEDIDAADFASWGVDHVRSHAHTEMRTDARSLTRSLTHHATSRVS